MNSVGIYDVEVFKAINRARTRLQKAQEIWSPCEMNCPISDSREMTLLKPDTVIHCSKCFEEIRRGVGFVCFKIPGKEGYRFFHCRFRGGDCWEAYLKESQSA